MAAHEQTALAALGVRERDAEGRLPMVSSLGPGLDAISCPKLAGEYVCA